MRLLFIVQGEGRGHLTQALAVRSMLESAGHTIARVLVGSVRHRELPQFFIDKIGAPIQLFDSPGFSLGKEQRSIRPLQTLIDNVARAPRFRDGLDTIHRTIREDRPDVVLTFYEPMAGIYQALHRCDVPFVAVAHQYMFDHPAYQFAPGRRMDKAGLKAFTRLTAVGSSWHLALSLYPAMDLPDDHITVIPPLLRRSVLEYGLDDVVHDDFFLIYLLNRGYADQVIAWHDAHPDVRLTCFWDNTQADAIVRHDDTLLFHRLDDTAFVEAMAHCNALICTAGFESVSEALYLGKPVLAVPVEGHYEQRCNAREVEMLGAGLAGDRFDLGLLIDYMPSYDPPSWAFRQWVALAEKRVLSVIEAVGGGRHPPPQLAVVNEGTGQVGLTSTAK